ncbi:hypothetical protein L484_001984 [Morus notabilis]|uniref:DUF4408 domain-containing protein n=1 Tax=Morus notabilis TaxID=981085 RepID=W9QVP8_9ROSA|nr:uncharacterized protein LOC21385565 [Morus notabilis]EXB55479.1 hypothetical protein L484_001984 [Morus notabilis]
MLDVTLDLITQTASSFLFAFCFCNLIIVIILVGSKPGSEFEQQASDTPPPAVSNTSASGKDVIVDSKDEYREAKNELVVVKEISNAEKAVCDDNDDDDKDDEDDDELRKRVEDFIEKVNRGWKVELSKLRI